MNGVIDTGLRPVWSGKGTTDGSAVFIPMTDAIDTTQVNKARISRYLESSSGLVTVERAYQMSDDGETWSATITAVGSYDATAGWAWDQSAATTVATDLRRFVRFGLLVKNSSGSKVERGMAGLRIELTPTSGRTLRPAPAQVWSDGTTGYTFLPLTEVVPFQAVGEIRGHLDMAGDSGDCEIIAAYQVSDDGVDWIIGGVFNYTTFGSARDGNGQTWGTTFTTFAPANTRQLVRFGIAAKNGAAGKVENCKATLMIDYRQIT